MLTTSTPDTKRSEDVRARLALLSEIPERWGAAVRRWSGLTAQYRNARGGSLSPVEGNRGRGGSLSPVEGSEGGPWPDRNIEYLFYQTLVGAWPIEPARMTAFMLKAAREAKTHTSWTRQDSQYEEALLRSVEAAMADHDLMQDVATFVQPLIEPGRVNSLAQVLLKLNAPGVPDTYQGTELWDLSLVDPDNRRPVDYALRRHLLDSLQCQTPEQIMARSDEGLPKLHLIHKALHLRRRLPEAFAGSYTPFQAQGAQAGRVLAFIRSGTVLTIVPRLLLGLQEGWQDTTLNIPPGVWQNELTNDPVPSGPVPIRDLLSRFPVALVARA